MKLNVKKAATSYLIDVFIQDSTSTTGAGKGGLTSGTAGLVCYRARSDDGNAPGTQIVLSANTRGTWSSGGFVEKDPANMLGVYELGIPNSALAAGSDFVIIMLSGAAGMAPLPLEIALVDYDPQDAVHLGLSSLPNTGITTNGSLLTSGVGVDQISVSGGLVAITSYIKVGIALPGFTFTMTDSTTHNPKPGLGAGVTAQRSLNGGPFAACTNTPSELSNGDYVINLSASDLNAKVVMLRFTAAAADDLNILLLTQP